MAAKRVNSDWSSAAMAVAQIFVSRSEHGLWGDPQVDTESLAGATGLTEQDVEDAIHELSNVTEHHHGVIFPKTELFATFDAFFTSWNPVDDALVLAAAMVNAVDFPDTPHSMAERMGWEPRRFNPAVAYLQVRSLVAGHVALGTAPFNFYAVKKTAATRRFVKSRSG